MDKLSGINKVTLISFDVLSFNMSWSYVRHLGSKTDHWDGKPLNKKRKKGREVIFSSCLLAICQSAMETIAVGFGSNRGLQEFDWSILITQLP